MNKTYLTHIFYVIITIFTLIFFLVLIAYCLMRQSNQFMKSLIHPISRLTQLVSKYEVFSGPYFPVFRPEKTPNLGTFHAVKTSSESLIYVQLTPFVQGVYETNTYWP